MVSFLSREWLSGRRGAALGLSYRLFELYLINFDSAKFVLELAVEEERIAIIDITALRNKEK